MPAMSIFLNGDGAWPDFDPAKALRGEIVAVARLQGGMVSGSSSIGLRIRLDNGREVFAETSMALFLAAARAFTAAEQGAEEALRAQRTTPN